MAGRIEHAAWGMAMAAAIGATLLAPLGMARAQQGFDRRTMNRAVDAAILSDISRDRRAERAAERAPYATPGLGPIATAGEAVRACGDEAVIEAGEGARLLGTPRAATMSTGWEVEGEVEAAGGRVPFVCSVRNGSLSAIALK